MMRRTGRRTALERRAQVRRSTVAAAAAALFAVASAAGAQTLTYTGSINYSTGRYIFDERSNAVILHNGVAFRTSAFRIGVGVPVVWQNSFAVNLVGDTWIPTGGPDHGVVGSRGPGQTIPTGKGRRAGAHSASFALSAADTGVVPDGWEMSVADPLFSGGLEVWSGWGAVRSIELTGAVKPGMASIESGAGTGEWDWSAGASVALAAGGALLFADASWWHYGDMPELELVDGVAWGAGLGLPIGDRFSLLASLTGSESVVDNIEAPLSLSVTGAMSMGTRSIHAGIAAGLSESSADLLVYAGWRFDLFSRAPVF